MLAFCNFACITCSCTCMYIITVIPNIRSLTFACIHGRFQKFLRLHYIDDSNQLTKVKCYGGLFAEEIHKSIRVTLARKGGSKKKVVGIQHREGKDRQSNQNRSWYIIGAKKKKSKSFSSRLLLKWRRWPRKFRPIHKRRTIRDERLHLWT